jgi:hypothetical protein
MEDKENPQWTHFLHQEQRRWSTVINTEPISAEIPLLKAELTAAKQLMLAPLFQAGGGQIQIKVEGFTIEWKWKQRKDSHKCSALDVRRGGWTWSVEDIGHGSESNELRSRVLKGKDEHVVWAVRGVGPYVCVIGERAFALEVKKQLIYYRLVSWNAYTGTDYKVHYEEGDFRFNLELVGAGPEGAFLRRQAGHLQDVFLIEKGGKLKRGEQESERSRKFVFGSKPGEYLVWTAESGVWQPSRALRQANWKLPDFHKAVPEILDTRKRILVTKWYGVRTVWCISKRENARTVWRGFGTITPDPWDGPWVRIAKAGCQAIWWNSEKDKRVQDTLSWCAETNGHFAVSRDGTRVPFVLIKPTLEKEPKGLLVIGYGAYGLPLPLGTARWIPLLQAGWALCLGLWRGGGDHTPEWEDTARVKGRGLVLEDAEVVVREAQRLTDVPAAHTVLFGRSAGGLWAGGLAAKFPQGNLAGGLYMEVPYLDVLRTVTNRELPLTDIETEEFGLPEFRLSDFRQTLRWSPMDTLQAEGTPGIWQIVRTGINDSQVFPYESAKWIVRSRGGEPTRPILLAIQGGQGHFVTGTTAVEQEAEDLAVLLFFTRRR